MQNDLTTLTLLFGRGRCPAGRAGRHQRWQFPAPLHDVGHGGSERMGDETDGTGRDDEGESGNRWLASNRQWWARTDGWDSVGGT